MDRSRTLLIRTPSNGFGGWRQSKKPSLGGDILDEKGQRLEGFVSRYGLIALMIPFLSVLSKEATADLGMRHVHLERPLRKVLDYSALEDKALVRITGQLFSAYEPRLSAWSRKLASGTTQSMLTGKSCTLEKLRTLSL